MTSRRNAARAKNAKQRTASSGLKGTKSGVYFKVSRSAQGGHAATVTVTKNQKSATYAIPNEPITI